MFVQHSLLTLPIHKRPRDRYYQDHDEWEDRQKPYVEKAWHSTFDELPTHIRIHWKDRWYWPPWFFNDLVGFLRLGTNSDEALGGDLFLKRRYFRLTTPERLYRHEESPRDREQVLYFWTIGGRPVDPEKNDTYLTATRLVIGEASQTVREFGRGTRTAKIWLPEYDLACIDFAEADRQLRRRA